MTWHPHDFDMAWYELTWHEVTWHKLAWDEWTWYELTWHELAWHKLKWYELTRRHDNDNDMTMTWHDMTRTYKWQDNEKFLLTSYRAHVHKGAMKIMKLKHGYDEKQCGR